MKKHFKKLITMLLVIALLVPTVAMISTNAVGGDPVELAFNNLFIFEKWATNKNSTTVQTLVQNGTNADGTPKYETPVDADGLSIDIENGSFTLTKNDVNGIETYTCFGGTGTDNFSYYMAEVDPDTSYIFYYHVVGNIWSFTPYVFYYDADGNYTGKMSYYATPAYNENSFTFTTPQNAEYIQVRFTIGDTAANRTDGTFTSFYATVKDIAICKAEPILNSLAPHNMFDLSGWASNAKSSVPMDPSTGTINVSAGKIHFTTAATASTTLFSGFGIDENASNDGFYTVEVQPSTSYTLTYDINPDNTLPALIHCQPYIVELDANNKRVNLFNIETPTLNNKREFTTQATTARIQVVFAVINDATAVSRTCTISNIGVYESSVHSSIANVDFETLNGVTHRKVYTEGAGNYTNLPTPANIPEGKVFAGWYTGEDGTGKLITSDTKISYESYTVYPKYETKLDDGGLKIATPATKLTYTLGEKVNTAGLVLEATVTTDGGTNVYKVNSGYRYSPETVATTPGTQTITVTYGGQSVSYDVTVVDSLTESVKVNGVATDVAVTNNEYFINLTGTDFNRYEITYYSDAYVKATLNTTATDGTTVSEEFFLEPSTNGDFVSFIDGFLDSTIYTNISSISFEPLNKDFFTFELYSVETILATMPTDNMQYQQDNTHKVGIDLSMGGALAYIEELSGNVVASYYGEGQAAQVDYKNMISGGTQISEGVNLINRHDPGRFVQQSYYGTREDPYVTGDYNGVEWNYNPVQGGNYKFESSKIIDYRITSNEIYVKTRPLDWGKYSDEFANSKEGDFVDNNGNGVWDEDQGELMLEPRYGDEYITDSYMEAWYVFEDNMVKTYCRFVDYSGYPTSSTTQELPAFYPIEPLNTFAYYQGDTVWEAESEFNYASKAYTENEPDFWGVSPNYNTMLKENNQPTIQPWVNNAENWAAFMGSDDENSFGIGIYSAGVTEFHYGTYPQIRVEPEVKNGVLNTALTSTQFNNADMYENGVVTMPDLQDATSYIAPVDTMTFESYKPYSYSYYIASGTLHDIREDFRRAKTDDEAAAVAGADIAVPETSYMKPADGASKIGQYYVNNILNTNNNYSIQTVAESTDAMSFGVHINGATKFTVDVVNVTNPSDDIDLYDANGNEVANTHEFALGERTGFATFDEGYYLAFNTTGLNYGDKATAKWVITGYDSSDEVVGTYTAYTVLYASERTIGAVAEARFSSSVNHEISSWITGANGVDHSQRAPLGSYKGDYRNSGYFRVDPLVNPTTPPTGGSTQTAYDYILGYGTQNGSDDDNQDDCYVMQTATNGLDDSRSHSYLGLLKIDKSRYTNTNQIPNLKIGYDALRVASGAPKDSLSTYNTYYTLGTVDSYTATSLSEAPSGWTQFSSHSEIYSSQTLPYRETVVPAYAVTDDIDGKYIHALNQGKAYSLTNSSYSTAGSSLLISLTDKSGLRDSVMEGYTLPEEKYSEDSYNKFLDKLEDAATVLGDPSASQESIDQAQKELDEVKDQLINVYYSLKYDNLFSAYEFSQHSNNMTVVSNRGTVSYNDGTLTVVNDTITGGEAYTNYGSGAGNYLIDLQPNTEYVFEYDVTTTVESQAFMFFYDANGNNGDTPTNMSIKIDNGNWSAKSESNSWWGNYQNSAGTNHYVIKFTTGANTTKASFRFGNTTNDPCESTFSNIKLIDAAHYYANATYSKTEDVYKEFDSYGTLVTPVRPGFTFNGWQDINGASVTGATIAEKNLSIYSQWVINDNALTADTVVIDFATPVKFRPLDNDTNLASSSGTKTLLGFSKDGGASYTATLTGTYGNFSFSGTEVTYTPTAVVNGADEVYYYVSDGTTTVKNKITVVPASNVLYEDTMFVAGSGTTGVEWQSAGGTALNLSTSDDGIYGYDTSYISDSQYSNNTALTATIDSDTKRSRIMTFTFTGTGFDLYSACGATTGVQIVTVKSNTTGKVVNATVVDTYYNDTSYGTLYQVPIVSITDLDHGSYTVQVAATYISNSGAVNNALSSQSVSGIDVYSATADNAAVREMLADAGMEYVLDAEEVNVVWFDDDSVFNGGKGVETQADGTVSTASTTVTLLNVIDSIRIYNPIVNGDAYYNTNEAGAQYYNVMDNLMNGGAITGGELFAYVSGDANTQITIDNYNSIGPKDEIYLANTTTKAITFTVGNVNADTRVMISLRAAYGKPKAEIGSFSDDISGKTEMYYDITDYIDKATGTVTIQNTSTDASLLAIGYVKVTGATATLLNTFDLETASAMMAAPAKEVDFNAPVTEPDATTPEDDTSTPEEDAGADDSSDAAESWLTRLINYIVELVKKIVSFTKSLFASVTSLLSF